MAKAKKAAKAGPKAVREPARFTVDEWCAIMGFLFRGPPGSSEWTGFMDAHSRRFVEWWERTVPPRAVKGAGRAK